MKKGLTREDVMRQTGMSATEYHAAYQRYWRLNRRISATIGGPRGARLVANIPSAVMAAWRHEQMGGRTPMFDQMRQQMRYIRNAHQFEVKYTEIRTQQLREKWGKYGDIHINVNGVDTKMTLNKAFELYKNGKISLEQYEDAIRQVKESDQYINYESKS